MAAIAKVQHTTGSSTDAGSISLTLNGVVAGNSLILVVCYTNNTATGPNLTSANITGMTATLSAEATGAAQSNGYGVRPRAFHQHNVTGGNKTVTVALAGEDYSYAVLMEVQGLANAAPDMVKYNVGTTSAGNMVVSTGLSTSTTQSNNLILAFAAHPTENSATTYTQPSGWTRVATQPDGFNSTSTVVEMRIAPTIDTFQADWTSNRVAQWSTVLVSFKGADVAPASGNPIDPLYIGNGGVRQAQLYDVIPAEHGGTGQFTYTPGNMLRAYDATHLEQRTPIQVAADIGAILFTASETAPALPKPGDEWLKPSTGKKYKWYNDGDSSSWVEMESAATVTGAAIQLYIQETQPSDTGPYFWVEWDGTDFSMWFNDGA